MKIMAGIILLAAGTVFGATEMEVVASVSQCYRDVEVLQARITALELELKTYQPDVDGADDGASTN